MYKKYILFQLSTTKSIPVEGKNISPSETHYCKCIVIDLLEMYPALCTEDQVDNITNFLISNPKGKSCILKIQPIILVGLWTAHISCNFISIFLTFKIQVVHNLQVSLQIHIWKVVY